MRKPIDLPWSGSTKIECRFGLSVINLSLGLFNFNVLLPYLNVILRSMELKGRIISLYYTIKFLGSKTGSLNLSELTYPTLYR